VRWRLVGLAAAAAAGTVVAYGMWSGPSYSDGPMPSVRDALSCDGKVFVTRQLSADRAGEPSPEAALQSGLLSSEQWWLDSDAVRVAHRSKKKVLFVHDVASRARFTAIVDRGDSGWTLSSWAMCDPSELEGATSEALGYGAWVDSAGKPVPTQRVMSTHGADRCDWQDVTFIVLDREADKPLQMVSDPSRLLSKQLMSAYDAHTSLPDDAKDTGWRRGGFALWMQPFGDAGYMVNLADTNDVERWPRARAVITCK
jgi:hypothetical protein